MTQINVSYKHRGKVTCTLVNETTYSAAVVDIRKDWDDLNHNGWYKVSGLLGDCCRSASSSLASFTFYRWSPTTVGHHVHDTVPPHCTVPPFSNPHQCTPATLNKLRIM